MKTTKTHVLRQALPLTLAVALAACAANKQATRPEVSPSREPLAFLWEVTRPDAPDRPLYITGTIHAGSAANPVAFPPSMQAAIGRAQAIVVELDPARAQHDATEMQKLALQLGTYQPPNHLSAHLTQQTIIAVSTALASYGLTMQQVEALRPWFLAMTLEMLAVQKAGYRVEQGTEMRILDEARGSKRIIELETAEEQLQSVASLPEAQQDLMLREQAEESEKLPETLAKITGAWVRGDAAGLAALVFEDLGKPDYQPIYEVLYFDRNRRMAEKIAPLVGGAQTSFVAVGAAHLVGEQGIVKLLERKGLRVRQLPQAAAAQ